MHSFIIMFPFLPMAPVFFSFFIFSSDPRSASSHLRASNMDLMAIACLSALDKAGKPQYITHVHT